MIPRTRLAPIRGSPGISVLRVQESLRARRGGRYGLPNPAPVPPHALLSLVELLQFTAGFIMYPKDFAISAVHLAPHTYEPARGDVCSRHLR